MFCVVQLIGWLCWFLSSLHPPLTWHRAMASKGMETHGKENITALPRASGAPSLLSRPVCNVASETSQGSRVLRVLSRLCCCETFPPHLLHSPQRFWAQNRFYPVTTSFGKALKDVSSKIRALNLARVNCCTLHMWFLQPIRRENQTRVLFS